MTRIDETNFNTCDVYVFHAVLMYSDGYWMTLIYLKFFFFVHCALSFTKIPFGDSEISLKNIILFYFIFFSFWVLKK